MQNENTDLNYSILGSEFMAVYDQKTLTYAAVGSQFCEEALHWHTTIGSCFQSL